MGYTRKDAVDFADAHWNTPADGTFWLSDEEVVIDQVRMRNVIRKPWWAKAPAGDGWQPFFVDDAGGGEKAVFRRVVAGVMQEILINPWEGIADCAHFLSRCLTEGGLSVNELSVPKMVKKLQGKSNIKTLCERVPQDAGQRVIDSGIFKPGDMVGYFNIDPKGDYNGAREYAHSAMYVGKIAGKTDGAITCHTICRFPGRSWVEDSWWLQPPGHYLYTLLHIADDDIPPNPVAADAMAGWWQIDYAGKTEYYLMNKTGSVVYTKKAPTPGQRVVHLAEGSAYWFMAAASGEITFTWRKTGTVEVWTPGSSGYSSKINGSIPGTLTKLP